MHLKAYQAYLKSRKETGTADACNEPPIVQDAKEKQSTLESADVSQPIQENPFYGGGGFAFTPYKFYKAFILNRRSRVIGYWESESKTIINLIIDIHQIVAKYKSSKLKLFVLTAPSDACQYSSGIICFKLVKSINQLSEQ